MGRNASGVRGVTLANDDDEVIGMVTVDKPMEQTVLVVSEKGYGKRSFLNDPEDGVENYRITNRGGKGVKTLSITEKTGNLIAIKLVTDENDLMIINRSGIMIRIAVADLRVMGRATQGVRLINLKSTDSIAAVAKVDVEEEVEEIYDEDGNLIVNEDSEANTDTEENESGKDVDNSTEEN